MSDITLDREALKILKHWMLERYSIFELKEMGQPRPWTKDGILRCYRFCNVFREDDTETRWIFNNWIKPNKNDKNLWFNMTLARLINWHESLEEIGYVKRWNPTAIKKKLKKRRDKGLKVFTGAYIVSTNGKSMDKIDYVVDIILTPLWNDREKIQPKKGDLLADFFKRLNDYEGMGSFMTAQVIADTKQVGVLSKAEDWYKWASSGPGSRRGLNRIFGRDKNAPWKEKEWLEKLSELNILLEANNRKMTARRLDLQNLQNCLCEFDKYSRVLYGEGKPRSRYNGE